MFGSIYECAVCRTRGMNACACFVGTPWETFGERRPLPAIIYYIILYCTIIYHPASLCHASWGTVAGSSNGLRTAPLYLKFSRTHPAVHDTCKYTSYPYYVSLEKCACYIAQGIVRVCIIHRTHTLYLEVGLWCLQGITCYIYCQCCRSDAVNTPVDI